MNKRIKELMIESGAYDHYEVNEGVNGDEKPMEKFAQLIINQCIEIIKQQDRIPAGFLYPKSADTHAFEIKQYFGLE